MSDRTATKILVRVQALGGKFLGDDIGGAVITIRDVQSGELLASGPTRGDSGNLSAKYSAGASLCTLVTPTAKGPMVQWLSPDKATAHFTAVLQLERPRLLEVSAFGPLGGLQSAHRVAVTEWFVPGQSVNGPPGLVLVIPGLLVQVMAPATHTALASSAKRQNVAFEANVAMMCGCPISNAPGNPWLPADFEVYADIRQVGALKRPVQRIQLGFNTAGTASLFCGSYQVAAGPGPTYYEATITAHQVSTGNVGTGTVTFFVKAPAAA